MGKNPWGGEVYKLSAVFVHIVGSLLVPMYFLLWNTLSRIPGTASILVFHGVREFCQFHTLLLLRLDLVEGWRSSVHVPGSPYRTIREKCGKHHVFSRLGGVRVCMPQGKQLG